MRGREKHGLTKTSEYQVWRDMRQRCNNPNAQKYHRYGGRGIKICERWSKFTNFREDMGKRPSEEYSIDRIDNDGNYEPSNCRWATIHEQMHNTSYNASNRVGVVKSRRKLNPWRVQISVRDKTIHIGCYRTIKDAIKARKQAELAYWS